MLFPFSLWYIYAPELIIFARICNPFLMKSCNLCFAQNHPDSSFLFPCTFQYDSFKRYKKSIRNPSRYRQYIVNKIHTDYYELGYKEKWVHCAFCIMLRSAIILTLNISWYPLYREICVIHDYYPTPSFSALNRVMVISDCQYLPYQILFLTDSLPDDKSSSLDAYAKKLSIRSQIPSRPDAK